MCVCDTNSPFHSSLCSVLICECQCVCAHACVCARACVCLCGILYVCECSLLLSG